MLKDVHRHEERADPAAVDWLALTAALVITAVSVSYALFGAGLGEVVETINTQVLGARAAPITTADPSPLLAAGA